MILTVDTLKEVLLEAASHQAEGADNLIKFLEKVRLQQWPEESADLASIVFFLVGYCRANIMESLPTDCQRSWFDTLDRVPAAHSVYCPPLMEGTIWKLGRKTGKPTRRFYMLRGSGLYHYKNRPKSREDEDSPV